jgi:hypothetical protein
MKTANPEIGRRLRDRPIATKPNTLQVCQSQEILSSLPALASCLTHLVVVVDVSITEEEIEAVVDIVEEEAEVETRGADDLREPEEDAAVRISRIPLVYCRCVVTLPPTVVNVPAVLPVIINMWCNCMLPS